MVHSAPASGVVDLRDDAAAASVEAALATAVGDDSLRVAYWLDADQAWVETDGGGHARAGRPGERAATVVEREGARLALIDHAAGVGADALDAAVHALAQGIDREREVAALRARIRDLEATEQRLLDVFEGIEVMVVSMDMDARMTYVNPFTERLSGWSREELLGANWFTTFRSGRESFLERVREGEFPPHDESTIILRNGDRRQIHWTNVALRDEGGRIIGVLGIGHDMTEQLRALRSLEAAERRMLHVFETVQLIVGQIDLEGRLTYVNEHLVRLSGWTREELLGRNYLDVFQTGSEAFLEQVQRGDFPAHDASSIQVRSGERRDIDWANVGLYDDHSKLSGVVGIGRDVTDQRKAEREAHELAAEHEALERVATEVARGVGEDAVFPLVAEQAGRLVAADGCTLLRFEPGEQARILANWSEIATDPVTPEGMVVLVSVGAAMAATYRSGRPEGGRRAAPKRTGRARPGPRGAARARPRDPPGHPHGARPSRRRRRPGRANQGAGPRRRDPGLQAPGGRRGSRVLRHRGGTHQRGPVRRRRRRHRERAAAGGDRRRRGARRRQGRRGCRGRERAPRPGRPGRGHRRAPLGRKPPPR